MKTKFIFLILVLILQPSTYADDAPMQRSLPKAYASDMQYKKSKYTSDKSEELADHRSLVLAAGVDKLIDLDFDANSEKTPGGIQIGNTAVVQVQSIKVGTKKQLLIKPLAIGDTNILIRDMQGVARVFLDVTVTTVPLQQILSDLKDRLLKDVEGLDYTIIGGKVYILGEVITVQDYGKVIDVMSDKRFTDNAVNKATLSPISLAELSKRIQKDVQEQGLSTVTASTLNGKIVLEGTVESVGQKQLAIDRANLYIPEIRPSEAISKDPNALKNEKPLDLVQNQIQVKEPPPKRESKLVRLTINFVELSKDYNKIFGFTWQPGFTSDPSISVGTTATGGVGAGVGTTAPSGFSFSGTLSSLFPALQSAQDAGYARVLKSATMLAKSTEKTYVKDTQKYFPTTISPQSGTIGTGNAIELGFVLEVTPTIIAQQNDVDLSLSLEQSDDIGTGPQGAPILAVHTVKTRVYVKSGEVAALAGVDTNDVATGYNRSNPAQGSYAQPTAAGGATTSPLFTLNRTKSFTKRKGQYVVFVTPQVVDNASDATQDMKSSFRMKSN